MAIEAPHVSCRFPLQAPQLLPIRESMSVVEGSGNLYRPPIGYGVIPLSGTTTETLIPIYGATPPKTIANANCGPTYYDLPICRKRSRDNFNRQLSLSNGQDQNQSLNYRCGSFTFLGEDVSLQIQQQQFEIDRFVAQHIEKVRIAIEDRRKRSSRRVVEALEEGMMKTLRDKEEEIEKIGNLNLVLEEKVKSLCVENQIWRELTQTNEATANALRINLEQVLAQLEDDQENRRWTESEEAIMAAELMEDAESCCGSNCVENSGGCEEGAEGKEENGKKKRWCRSCGEKESCVLLLPCRHLCLCTVCGSSLLTCPVCKSTKNASLHVNLSPS